MATAVLGRKNDYGDGDVISGAELNGAADDLEWVAAGYLSKSVAGGAEVTLSAAEYESSVLDLTGLLTANINVVLPPHAGRRWVVLNNTTGAYTVNVKTAAGTGIVVTQGYAAVLACDGTNIVRRTVDVNSAGGIVTTSPRVVTDVRDVSGNELLQVSATASAVNHLQLANAATGAGPIAEAVGDDTNIDVTLRGKGSGGVQLSRSGGKLGCFGVTPAARASALTQTYATAERTLGAYTPDAESGAYTGIDNAQGGTPYAQLTDLNALRVAYENLRALTEDLAQFVNALVDDLQTYGLEQ